MDKNLMLMIILTNSITTFTKKIQLTIDYVFPIGLFMSSEREESLTSMCGRGYIQTESRIERLPQISHTPAYLLETSTIHSFLSGV